MSSFRWGNVVKALCMCFLAEKTLFAYAASPHIIFILADDLGWNDVGFHGSNEMATPNIDALAYTGIILNNYYVAPVCTPSRSALLTGKYPIHTGMQHRVIYGGEPWGLGTEESLLSELLKSAGYETAAVGKWHLGHFKKEYLPTSRGFDTHYGYWTGHQDYYDHTAVEKHGYWGYDMRRGMEITWSDYGNYTTDLFTDEAVRIIENHERNKPLFLYMSHLATHSANFYSPLQAPQQTLSKFNYIADKNRRLFAGMLSKLDDSVGSIVSALSKRSMLQNSVIIFSTDNGGPAAGFDLNAASNWPLRGVKDTLWEGGVKGVGLIWSPLLPSSKVHHALIHITDWFPTLLSLTNSSIPNNLDGLNVWSTFFDSSLAMREEILLNIDTERNVSALIYQNWKLIKGHSNAWNEWYGPSGRYNSYNWQQLYNSPVAQAVNKIKKLPEKTVIKKLREMSQVKCSKQANHKLSADDVYLFNLHEDPCEQKNLAATHPEIAAKLNEKMEDYKKTMVPPRNKGTDPRSNPKYWGYAWVNWKDFL